MRQEHDFIHLLNGSRRSEEQRKTCMACRDWKKKENLGRTPPKPPHVHICGADHTRSAFLGVRVARFYGNE